MFTAGAQLTLGYGVKMLIDKGFAGSEPSGSTAVIFMLIIGLAMAVGAMIRFTSFPGWGNASAPTCAARYSIACGAAQLFREQSLGRDHVSPDD